MLSKDIISIISEIAQDNPKTVNGLYLNLQSLSKIFDSFRDIVTDKNIVNMRSRNFNTNLHNNVSKQLTAINTEQADIEEVIAQLKKYCSDKVLDKPIRIRITTNDRDCPDCYKDELVKMRETTISYNIYDEEGNRKITRSVQVMSCPVCKGFFVGRETGRNLKEVENTNLSISMSYNMPKSIGYYDFVVVSNITNCTYSNHKVDDLSANIQVILPNGTITIETINTSYCKVCDRFTILKKDYETLRGIPVCKIVDKTKKSSIEVSEFDFSDNDNETFFTQKGYNVNCNDGLSSAQRHRILEQILKNHEKSQTEICSYIDALITRGEKIPSWSNAVSKWKEDREYISNIKNENNPNVEVESLTLKYTV